MLLIGPEKSEKYFTIGKVCRDFCIGLILSCSESGLFLKKSNINEIRV